MYTSFLIKAVTKSGRYTICITYIDVPQSAKKIVRRITLVQNVKLCSIAILYKLIEYLNTLSFGRRIINTFLVYGFFVI